MIIYSYLALLLFFAGLAGMILKRDGISQLLCIELMFCAVNLLIVIFSKGTGVGSPILLVVFVLSVSIIQMMIGIALLFLLFSKTRSTSVESVTAP